MGRLSRRSALVAGAVAALVSPTESVAAGATLGPRALDDASRLNAVPIARRARLAGGIDAAWLDRLRGELRAAAAEGRPIAVGAARHSMGGQALPRSGIAIDLDAGGGAGSRLVLDVDAVAGVYHVPAGARWHAVIRALDPLARSPSDAV